MREYRRRRVTPYSATIGASEASGGRRQPTQMRPTGCGGAGASPALALLPDTHGIVFVALPWICPRGASQRDPPGFSSNLLRRLTR